MNKKLRMILIAALGAVFLGSGIAVLVQSVGYRADRAVYETARETFVVEPVTDPIELRPEASAGPEEEVQAAEPLSPTDRHALQMEVDLAGLQAVNEDVIGWIWCPGTTVTYPLLIGSTNNEYLRRSYENKYSAAGSIYADYRNARDFSDPHTILYGHNRRDGSMFAPLLRFREEEFARRVRIFYIFTPEGVRKYEIFAAYETDMYSEAYRVDFDELSPFDAWLDGAAEQSLYELGEKPDAADTIVTLSTCRDRTGRARVVVQGRFTELLTPDMLQNAQ